jgi:hypothetical protein
MKSDSSWSEDDSRGTLDHSGPRLRLIRRGRRLVRVLEQSLALLLHPSGHRQERL